VNFALIRGTEGLTVEGSAYLAVLAYAFVPSLSLLTVAAVNAVRGLVKCGQAPPFSTGYLLLGGTASFGVCLALAPMTFTLFVSVPYCVPGHVQESSLLEDLWNYGQLIAMFALPQVVPALIGGGLAVRYRLAIVFERSCHPS